MGRRSSAFAQEVSSHRPHQIQLPQSLIFGDPVRLHQVLGNLIGNSLKFTENGSITVGARTDWETEEAVKLTFWVKDTGIGIPAQQLVKLFKPFSQADASTARKYGGSGLGLSICKSLIESMMGGTIELESAENQGTTAWFTVTFPKANPEASAGDSQNGIDAVAKTAEKEAQMSTTAYIDFSSVPREQVRICIAEDNPINQKIAMQFMEKLGFKHVDAYDNGLAAVEGLRKKAKENEPYQIILMDVQMPVLDGYEATKLLRRDPIEAVRGILVIAMTASAIQGDREKCLASGMNDYLAKPVRSGVLKKKLDQYLLQTPLTVPNLQAEARRVAKDVLKNFNGSENTALLKDSGDTTPTTSDRGTAPTTARTSPAPPIPPRAASRTRTPADCTVPVSRVRDRLELDGAIDKPTIDTAVVTKGRPHDEELSPKSIPNRIRDSIDEGLGKKDSSTSENFSLAISPIHHNRSPTVVRDPLPNDGTSDTVSKISEKSRPSKGSRTSSSSSLKAKAKEREKKH